jgi:hypothetical protein
MAASDIMISLSQIHTSEHSDEKFVSRKKVNGEMGNNLPIQHGGRSVSRCKEKQRWEGEGKSEAAGISHKSKLKMERMKKIETLRVHENATETMFVRELFLERRPLAVITS